MTRPAPVPFTYQDTLRAVGAWLDVRGYREVRIVEADGALVVEAATGTVTTPAATEVLRFDAERMLRLREAALCDRGVPRAYPAHSLAVSTAWETVPVETEPPLARP
ncbi:MAG TPA: hypothetical protein VH482_22715 [Thermomicrobiales bacterium]|jgi:hypothetical protein